MTFLHVHPHARRCFKRQLACVSISIVRLTTNDQGPDGGSVDLDSPKDEELGPKVRSRNHERNMRHKVESTTIVSALCSLKPIENTEYEAYEGSVTL